MTFKKLGTESYEILTEIFDITPWSNYVEFSMKDGKYIFYKFNLEHTITEKIVWDQKTYNLASGKGIPGESIQGTYKG